MSMSYSTITLTKKIERGEGGETCSGRSGGVGMKDLPVEKEKDCVGLRRITQVNQIPTDL